MTKRGYDAARSLELLRLGSGLPGAEFRPGQEAAIRHVVEGRGRLLVIEKTGWGKSFVYFIANRLLREAGLGPALLISPLLSLMRNQLVAAARMGVRAVTVNSSNQDDWAAVAERVAADEVDILLVSPERLANEEFVAGILAQIAARVALLVIDEAHCISDWGHDFRPDYRRIERMVRLMPSTLRVLATTATANDRVTGDLRDILGGGGAGDGGAGGGEVHVQRGDLRRDSLTLQTIRLPSQVERLAWLAEQVPQLPGSGIVYALTRRDAAQVAEWLRESGVAAEAYSTDSGDRREELELALQDNRLKALVATTALGMGYDKPDLGFVVHYQAPASVIHYYQQVGRAGRALESAYGILLTGDEDDAIHEFFIRSAFPTEDEVRRLLKVLEDSEEGLSTRDLERRLNMAGERIAKALKLLLLESPSPIVREGARYGLTANPLSPEFHARAARLTALREREKRQMADYAALEAGHMEFLVRALNGTPREAAGGGLPMRPTTPGVASVRKAEAFLRRAHLVLEPRRQWAANGMPRMGVRGRIAVARRSEGGRVLCMLRDGGWGRSVFEGKFGGGGAGSGRSGDGRFAEELVAACVEMLETWGPDPAPRWVTCVPSLRHPELVPDLARRLAGALELPFVPTLEQLVDRPEQKTMANSMQQALNVDGSLGLIDGVVVPEEPVLLVDDTVDSRWTFTVAAWLLRGAGSGEVHPLALAKTGRGE